SRQRLSLLDSHRLRAFPALFDLELHPVTLIQFGITLHLDLRVMDEHILLTALRLDEAVALLGVKPLHRARYPFCHATVSLSCSVSRITRGSDCVAVMHLTGATSTPFSACAITSSISGVA